jgi:acyl-CoA thioesterase FadM
LPLLSHPFARRNARVRPTDLALNRLLGITDAPPGAPHLLVMPWSTDRCNHVGTVHAAAQFALAEAASAECLRREFPDLAGSQVLAVVRSTETRFRRAARGDLHACARLEPDAADGLRAELGRRGQAFITVNVELRDLAGAATLVGRITWYMRQGPGA